MDTKLLQELYDKQAIRDRLARYCEMIDEYNLDTLKDLFTADCFSDYGPGRRGGPLTGSDALYKRLQAGLKRYRHTHHQLGQIDIELNGDEATSIAYAIADHIKQNGEFLSVRLQYRDRWARTPAGWCISHRRTLVSLVTGSDDGDTFNMIPRRNPEP